MQRSIQRSKVKVHWDRGRYIISIQIKDISLSTFNGFQTTSLLPPCHRYFKPHHWQSLLPPCHRYFKPLPDPWSKLMNHDNKLGHAPDQTSHSTALVSAAFYCSNRYWSNVIHSTGQTGTILIIHSTGQTGIFLLYMTDVLMTGIKTQRRPFYQVPTDIHFDSPCNHNITGYTADHVRVYMWQNTTQNAKQSFLKNRETTARADQHVCMGHVCDMHETCMWHA